MGMLVSPYRHATPASAGSGVLIYDTAGGWSGGNLVFASEALDPNNWHSAADNSKLIVPAAGLIRLAASAHDTSGNIYTMTKNGGGFDGRAVFGSASAGTDGASGCSAIIAAAASDYFQLAGSSPSSGFENWLGAEVLAPSTRYALARRSTSNQTLTSGSSAKVVFNNELTDPHGLYDPATGSIALPAGLWRVTACIETANAANAAAMFITDGAAAASGSLRGQGGSSEGNYTFGKYMCASTAVLEVAVSQALSVYALASAASSVIASDHTWVCIEEVPNYSRALLYRSANQSIPSSTTTLVSMDSAVYGAGLMASGGIQVPSGVTEGRISVGYDGPDNGSTLVWGAQTSDSLRRAGVPHDRCEGFYNTTSGLGMWRPVTPGEIYGLYVFPTAGGTTLSDSSRTWICGEFR